MTAGGPGRVCRRPQHEVLGFQSVFETSTGRTTEMRTRNTGSFDSNSPCTPKQGVLRWRNVAQDNVRSSELRIANGELRIANC